MTKPEIYYFAEQQWSPISKLILKEAAREVYPEGARMVKTEPGEGVIGFGVRGDGMIRCLSPAQVATQPNAVSAVKQALMLQRDGVILPQLDYRVIDSRYDFARALHLIGTRYDEPVTIDIEWDINKDMLSLAMNWGDGIMVFSERFVQDAYLHVLADAIAQCYYIIGHNWKSDAGVILDHTGIRLPVWFDTMYAHHTLFMAATGQHGLKEMAESMLGVPDWDSNLHQYTGKGDKADYGKAPRELLYKYNAYDVLYTHELYKMLLPMVEGNPSFWLETHAGNALLDIEHNRLKVDVEYLQHLSAELQKELDTAYESLPDGLNPNSPKQVKEYFESEGLNLPNTKESTLLEHSDNPAVAPILEYRGVRKQKSTYCDNFLEYQKDGFLKASWNVHGTSTGRLSSSAPFNAQNIPRESRIRATFIPRAQDRKLLSLDYGQVELRVSACLSDDKDLQQLFQPGSPDFFDFMMPVAFPGQFADEAEFQAFKEAFPDKAKELRTQFKTVQYGLMFGRQAKAIGEALGSDEHYAQGIIDNFLNGFPTYRDWRLDIMAAAVFDEDRSLLVTPLGRVFNSEVVTFRNRQNIINAALAFLPQSTASDLCVQAAIWANNWLRTEGVDAKIVSLVHDNILVDVHQDITEEVGDMIQGLMRKSGETVFGDMVLFDTDRQVADNWGEVN